MSKTTIDETEKCLICGQIDGQIKNGRDRSGTQTCLCKHCKKTYTLEPKSHAYSEETRKLDLKIYYAGASGRGVGKVLGMNKANVYNWIKKTGQETDNRLKILEMDELYWFVERKTRRKQRNTAQTGIWALLTWLIRAITSGMCGTRATRSQLRMWTRICGIISRFLRVKAAASPEKIETLYAAVEMFVGAYNRFGAEKYKYRQIRQKGEFPFSVLDFI